MGAPQSSSKRLRPNSIIRRNKVRSRRRMAREVGVGDVNVAAEVRWWYISVEEDSALRGVVGVDRFLMKDSGDRRRRRLCGGRQQRGRGGSGQAVRPGEKVGGLRATRGGRGAFGDSVSIRSVAPGEAWGDGRLVAVKCRHVHVGWIWK